MVVWVGGGWVARMGGVGVCAVYVEVEKGCDGVNRAVGWVTGCLVLL